MKSFLKSILLIGLLAMPIFARQFPYDLVNSGTHTPTLSLTSSGLLTNESFSNLGAWNQFGGNKYTADASAPEYVFYPHAKTLLPLAISGQDSQVMREPLPMRFADGNLYLYYDSGSGSAPWAACWAVSTDNGNTWSSRGNVLGLPLSGYDGLDTGFLWQSNATYYFSALTATSHVASPSWLPNPPYGNHLYSNTNPTNGTWTSLADNDPPLGSFVENVTYHIFSNSVTGKWENYTALSFATNTFTMGMYNSALSTGPWALVSSNVLPANVQGSVFGGPENPRIWHSSTLGIYAMTANELPGGRVGVWYATSLTNLFSSVRHVSIQNNSLPYVSNSLSPASPIYNLSNTAIEDANGGMGFVYSTDDATSGEGGFLGAGQLEPHPSAMKFADAGATPDFITSTQPALNGILEFTVEFSQGTGDVGFLWNGSSDGTDGGTSGYVIDVNPSNPTAGLYSEVNGSFTLLASGNHPPLPFTADSLNQHHLRFKISKNAGALTVDCNGTNICTFTDGSPKVGTKLGFRNVQTAARIINLTMRTSDAVTVNGIKNGDVVSLLGSGNLVAASATSSGASVTVSHYHFPLYAIQINGTVYPYPNGVWGGDIYNLQ